MLNDDFTQAAGGRSPRVLLRLRAPLLCSLQLLITLPWQSMAKQQLGLTLSLRQSTSGQVLVLVADNKRMINKAGGHTIPLHQNAPWGPDRCTPSPPNCGDRSSSA